MPLLEKITGQVIGLANIINWDVNTADPTYTDNAKIQKIQRADISNNGLFGDLYNLTTNIPLKNTSFADYDISLCKTYEYKLTIDDGLGATPYDKYIYIRVINEHIKNCKATYNFNTNIINVNWDKLINNNDITKIHYNVWICLKRENENLVRFDVESTECNINSNSNFNIQTGTYFIYVTPKYATTKNNGQSITNVYPERYFKKNGKVTGIPLKIINIEVETPENFEIQSAYNNGKISFSWNLPSINPKQYLIEFKRGTETETTDISFNTDNNSINSYTLDNTDLSLVSAFKPGNYSVSVKSRFLVDGSVTLESSLSNTLNFNIPVTPIALTVTLDNKTIKLNWTKVYYANYYKITVKGRDKDGTLVNDLVFYTNTDVNSKDFNIDKTDQVELKFSVSYSEEEALDADSNWPYGLSVQQSKNNIEFPTEFTLWTSSLG